MRVSVFLRLYLFTLSDPFSGPSVVSEIGFLIFYPANEDFPRFPSLNGVKTALELRMLSSNNYKRLHLNFTGVTLCPPNLSPCVRM